MASTVNISLPASQKKWLEHRQQSGQFTSKSDVVQDLIRREQEAEHERLRTEFSELETQSPGASGSEPESAIVAVARQVKRSQRLDRRHT